jgi:UDP-glucose 4-epimerase
MHTLNTTVLVTGGAGYIGSHTVLALLEAGYQVIVLDNLCNSSSESLQRVAQIAGTPPIFVRGDIRDRALLDHLFGTYPIQAVLHFAGLKAVGESVHQPLHYYDNNVHGSMVLLQAMAAAGVFELVFSSSATVYGEPAQMPIAETCPIGQPTNPYGRSKLIVEDILRDVARSEPRWRIAILRYFNPVGAHDTGLIGEEPNGIPNNLMPFVAQVAVGRLSQLTIFGNDYPTPDGTGVRDYIHVMDLAEGHVTALQFLTEHSGFDILNLGTGTGLSVLEMVQAFEKVSLCPIPYQIVGRRTGDIASCYADASKALEKLNWKTRRDLTAMCESAWRWQQFCASESSSGIDG